MKVELDLEKKTITLLESVKFDELQKFVKKHGYEDFEIMSKEKGYPVYVYPTYVPPVYPSIPITTPSPFDNPVTY